MSVTGLSPTGQRSEELLRSPTLSGGLMVLLVAVGLLDVALIGMAANLGTRPVGSQDCLSKAEGFDAVAMVAVIASITAYLFFFWWLAHRAAQLPRLRVAEQAYSPRVVALTALLPLATGFQLLWTVGELWRSSSTPVDFSDSRSWRRAPAGTLVFLWWVTTMVTGLVCLLWIHSLLTLSTMLEIGEGEVSNHLLITVLTGAIQFIAVGFTMALIQTIDNRQLERFRAIQKRYEATAPVSGAPHAGTAARVPLSASHCTKALGIALAFQALFVLVAVVLALPAWCHLFSTQAILLAVAVTLARSEGVPLSRLAALSKPRSTEIAGGAMVGVGAFALATMWLFPWVEARFALGQDEQPGALEAIPELVVLLPILIVVVAPLVEEILFRGVLFEALSSALPATTVIVLTAAVFAVMHAHPPQIVTTFVLGLHLGLVRALSGSVSGSIVVHLVNNLGALLVLPRFDAAREPLPGDLVLPIAVLLVLGYFLSMSHRIDDLSALISGRGTSDATPASRQMADSLRSTQVKAERAAHFTSPILHALRVQLLGGPLAHGLAVALAIFHSVRYAGGTLLSWRENGSLGLVAAGFFSFWAWCMWQDRKTPSLILLVPFVLMWPLHGLMAQHFGLWELMVMAVFCLGVLAVFREQHILDIVPESLA
ncbi:MAG: CPBP family intramembrane metalloprotease, partial [bacterium]|nr:CPBP family intramembrane metalloprotease [bacterium]